MEMRRIAFALFEKRVAFKKEEVKVPRTTCVVNECLTSSFDYIRRIFRTSQIINQSLHPPDTELFAKHHAADIALAREEQSDKPQWISS